LEDAPFYARSLLDGGYGGQPAAIMHESLSLRRFRQPIVQAMLPFRMPRTLW
jgi:carotenoid 1,2-hydratase